MTPEQQKQAIKEALEEWLDKVNEIKERWM